VGNLKSRIRKIERMADNCADTLVLPTGEVVRVGEGERLDALLAAIDGEEHWLLPHLMAMDPAEEELANLVQAIEGGEDEG
jgi:hypothetical protein